MHLHEDLYGKMVWNMAMGQDMALEPISMCMKVLRSSFGGRYLGQTCGASARFGWKGFFLGNFKGNLVNYFYIWPDV